jgi:hypothetical protein
MSAFLGIMLSFPTVVFTVMLSLSLIYWLFVILGALDMDLLGSADGAADGLADGMADGLVDGAMDGVMHGVGDGCADGVLDGVAHGVGHGVIDGMGQGVVEGVGHGVIDGMGHGVVDGVGHGVVDGMGHGVADGAAEGAADGALEGAAKAAAGGHEGLAGFFSALRLRSVPVTVSFSMFSALAWLLSSVTMQTFGPMLESLSLPTWLLGLPVLVVVSVLALFGTSIAVRPLGKLFQTHGATRSKTDLVGKVCVVSTGRVTESFGQANLEDGGAGLILQVRARAGNGLQRGDRVLIIGWDDAAGGFSVEPMKDLLPDSADHAAVAREAAAVAEATAVEEAAAKRGQA